MSYNNDQGDDDFIGELPTIELMDYDDFILSCSEVVITTSENASAHWFVLDELSDTDERCHEADSAQSVEPDNSHLSQKLGDAEVAMATACNQLAADPVENELPVYNPSPPPNNATPMEPPIHPPAYVTPVLDSIVCGPYGDFDHQETARQYNRILGPEDIAMVKRKGKYRDLTQATNSSAWLSTGVGDSGNVEQQQQQQRHQQPQQQVLQPVQQHAQQIQQYQQQQYCCEQQLEQEQWYLAGVFDRQPLGIAQQHCLQVESFSGMATIQQFVVQTATVQLSVPKPSIQQLEPPAHHIQYVVQEPNIPPLFAVQLPTAIPISVQEHSGQQLPFASADENTSPSCVSNAAMFSHHLNLSATPRPYATPIVSMPIAQSCNSTMCGVDDEAPVPLVRPMSPYRPAYATATAGLIEVGTPQQPDRQVCIPATAYLPSCVAVDNLGCYGDPGEPSTASTGSQPEVSDASAGSAVHRKVKRGKRGKNSGWRNRRNDRGIQQEDSLW